PVGDDKFALLVGLHEEDGAYVVDDEDEDVIIAKIVAAADGEDEYIEPTDEEFAAVEKAYNALCDEEEQK
ncbi:MAG: DUF1292 domain-containing protein, partial [Selenomonadaceae bacterium]|nr:DUF1292 domain-containing protein [Selenomonadaceae bacterium]